MAILSNVCGIEICFHIQDSLAECVGQGFALSGNVFLEHQNHDMPPNLRHHVQHLIQDLETLDLENRQVNEIMQLMLVDMPNFDQEVRNFPLRWVWMVPCLFEEVIWNFCLELVFNVLFLPWNIIVSDGHPCPTPKVHTYEIWSLCLLWRQLGWWAWCMLDWSMVAFAM